MRGFRFSLPILGQTTVAAAFALAACAAPKSDYVNSPPPPMIDGGTVQQQMMTPPPESHVDWMAISAPNDPLTPSDPTPGQTVGPVALSGTTTLLGGTFYKDMQIDATVLKSNLGGNDAFLAAFDATGVVLWAAEFGGTAGTATVSCIVVGPSGDFYVGGFIDGGSTFLDAAWTGSSAFIARVTTAGHAAWVVPLAGQSIVSLAVDGQERVWVLGTGEGPQTLGNFLAQVSDAGDVNWNVAASGWQGVNPMAALATPVLAVDSTGTNVIVAGSPNGADSDFGASLYGMNTDGSVAWTETFTYGANNGSWVMVTSLVMDAAGGVYAAGKFRGGAMGAGSLQLTGTASGFSDGFIAHYSASHQADALVEPTPAQEGAVEVVLALVPAASGTDLYVALDGVEPGSPNPNEVSPPAGGAIARLNSSLSPVWAEITGGDGDGVGPSFLAAGVSGVVASGQTRTSESWGSFTLSSMGLPRFYVIGLTP